MAGSFQCVHVCTCMFVKTSVEGLQRPLCAKPLNCQIRRKTVGDVVHIYSIGP